MCLLDCFNGVLVSLGILKKEATVLFLGRSDTYKSVFLRTFDDEYKGGPLPKLDQNLTSGKLTVGNLKFKAFDFGGHQIVNRVLQDYDIKVDAVVYFINALNGSMFHESRASLHHLLLNDSLANVPFLILVLTNPDHRFVSERRFVLSLGLTNHTTGKRKVNLAGSGRRPLEVFMVDIGVVEGHREAFEWVSQYI